MEPNHDQLIFYEDVNFKGQSYIYNVGISQTFSNNQSPANKFKSLKVGTGAKVICFENREYGGRWETYDTGEYRDITGIGEIKKFQTMKSTADFGIPVRLRVLSRGAATEPFYLEFNRNGEVLFVVDEVAEGGPYVVLPILSPTKDILLSVNIKIRGVEYDDRNSPPIYFRWNSKFGDLDALPDERNADLTPICTRDDRTCFTFFCDYRSDVELYCERNVVYFEDDMPSLEDEKLSLEDYFLKKIMISKIPAYLAPAFPGALITTDLNEIDFSRPGQYPVTVTARFHRSTTPLSAPARAVVILNKFSGRRPALPRITSKNTSYSWTSQRKNERMFLDQIGAETIDGSAIKSDFDSVNQEVAGNYLVHLRAKNEIGSAEKVIRHDVLSGRNKSNLRGRDMIEEKMIAAPGINVYITVYTGVGRE